MSSNPLNDRIPPINEHHRRLDGRIAISAAILILAALTVVDYIGGASINPSIVYPTLFIACWWARSHGFVWLLTVLAIVSMVGIGTYEVNAGMYPPDMANRAIFHRFLGAAVMLVSAGVFRHLITTWQQATAANAELEAREHEIATQNEELRSQTEELERQSEELRVANDELARRERSLESMLRLSRSLNAEMSRSDTLDRICQALSEMVNGPNLGVGVKLREGNNLRIACHYGFGPKGPQSDTVPYERSFARLVLERNHTGYLEDIDLRPDVMMPQPREGEKFHSILAAPLRVNGHAVGTLEVYSRDRRTWSEEQIGMVESLAAQTSISLQAAELFERVEEERRRFETIFRTLPLGVSVVHSASGRVLNNPAAVMMLGVKPEGRASERYTAGNFRIYRAGTEVGHDQTPMSRALAGEDIIGEEVELLLGTGQRITVLASAAPVRTPDGKFEGAIVAFTDITALKALQYELDSQRRAAEEGSFRKTRFLAQVSHDIRNPVNAISLLAELLFRTASDPAMAHEVPSIAGDLKRNAVSLVDLVSDVLDLTRFDAGRIELEETEFSLKEMLSDECRGYQEMAAEKGVEFHFEARPLVIRTDRVKLSRVMGNLLSNALKFTQNGKVQVSAGLHKMDGQGDGVFVRVSDSGPGIAPEFHERIFDEFFQLRSNGNSRSGAGLGLAICKRLIGAMGGTIRVESTPGEGSTFLITLPPQAVKRV